MRKERRDAIKLLAACGNEVKKLPDGKLPEGAQFHVCSTRPTSPKDGNARCMDCGCPVFFAEPYLGVPKICIPCVLKKTSEHGIEGFASDKAFDNLNGFISSQN